MMLIALLGAFGHQPGTTVVPFTVVTEHLPGVIGEGVNPFTVRCDISLYGPPSSRYRSPGAKSNATATFMTLGVYYDGNSTWGFRFTPDVVGNWSWFSYCPGYPAISGKNGTVGCVAATPSSAAGVRIRSPPLPNKNGATNGNTSFR